MAMTNLEILQGAEKFAAENRVECCQELIEWRDKAVLPTGKIRELAGLLKPLASPGDSLKLAESIVTYEALKFSAKG